MKCFFRLLVNPVVLVPVAVCLMIWGTVEATTRLARAARAGKTFSVSVADCDVRYTYDSSGRCLDVVVTHPEGMTFLHVVPEAEVYRSGKITRVRKTFVVEFSTARGQVAVIIDPERDDAKGSVLSIRATPRSGS